MSRTVRERSIPVDRLTLRFHSRDVEKEYEQVQLARSIGVYRAAVVLSVLIHIAYLPLDTSILGEHARTMWMIRFLVCIPASLIGLTASYFRGFHRWSQPLTTIMAGLHGLSMVAGHALYGVSTSMYFVPGVVMVVMYGYILLGLRFVYSSVLAVVLVALDLAVLLVLRSPVELLVNSAEVLLISTVILGVGAYRMELMSRTEFWTAEQLLRHERYQREAEAERGRWLSVIAGFVRHELKNAIAGVGSSLQLISRAPLDARSQEYVGRAERSLQFMRNVLQQVGDATSLETALQRQDMEPLPFSDLVAERLQDYRNQSPQTVIDEHLQPGLQVDGNADSLIQMLDKLVNNAIEHSSSGSPVSIALRDAGDRVQLEVTNRGDALPENVERLFQPFVSTKAGARDGNLGLGLYVAKVIVTHHRGRITAEPLRDPPGARFVVDLPRKTS